MLRESSFATGLSPDYFIRIGMLLGCMLAAGLHAGEKPPAPSLREAWEAAAQGRFAEAQHAFALQTGREAQLGAALNLLQMQPRTEAKVAQAAEQLAALVAADPDDQTGISALYFLARIEHIARYTPDLEAAARHYRRLIETHPRHPLAGQAIVKLAIITLYAPDAARTPAETRAHYDAFDARTGRLPTLATQRDLHLVLGDAALRLRLGDDLALRHYLAALQAGILRPPLRADTLIKTGELARDLRQTDLARVQLQTFLDEFPRDTRRLAVGDTLATLPPAQP